MVVNVLLTLLVILAAFVIRDKIVRFLEAACDAKVREGRDHKMRRGGGREKKKMKKRRRGREKKRDEEKRDGEEKDTEEYGGDKK